MDDREKIAQIIAEHLCPQGKAHKTLYGAERMCYSRNNFADCEKVSECVDALIAANIGDVTEWKERAEKAERRLKSAKQKPRKTNIYYGTARLEHLNGDPHEILCPYCGENIKFHVSDTCPYCNALLFKKTSRGAKDKYSDILQLKSFCERNGIKCTLTRRIEDFNGKLKDRDGYKITFLNGDVIQCADTNGYFEFYNCHNEVDGKWIGLQRAKSFVLRYKNWLDLNNKPNANKEEEKGE